METSEINIVVSLNLPSIYVERIKSVSPRIRVRVSTNEKELLELVKDADILFAGIFSREMFLAAKKLRWIQSFWAGVDRLLFPEVVKSNVLMTTAGGVNSTPVAEHAVGMMFCLNRKMHLFIRNQIGKKWKQSDRELLLLMEELSEKTVGIVGLGRIGSEIAKKANCLGMRVVATKRNLGPPPDYVDRLVHPDNLKELLSQSDFVVLSLPLTRDTEGMIGEAEFRSMKPTGYLINVSRGKLVREEALIEALRQGWISGAGLDAFATEPLPEDSPLWDMKNVIITPHVAGLTPYYLERLTDLFRENLKRFTKGETLLNVVDKTLGY